MKNVLSIVIIGMIIFSGIAITTAENNNEIKEEKIIYKFSNPNIETANNEVFIQIEGANELYSKENYYRIPYREELLTFPWGTKIIDITYKIGTINKQTIPGKLEVTPKPTILGMKNNDLEKNKEKPLTINKWLSYDIGGGIDGNNRCIILKLELFPIQYQPDKNTIEWTKNLEITIKYLPPDTKTSTTNDEQYTLVILAPSEFRSQLQTLVNHKISRGITTKLVTLNEIYTGTYFPPQGRDNQEKIKYFIKNAIEQWDTTNILLVGSIDKFPVRYTNINVDNSGYTPAADLYYADIYDEDGNFQTWDTNSNGKFGEQNWNGQTDEIDGYPDVAIGRLACVDTNEVTTVVNKIINYENNEAYKQEWFTNLVVVGGDTAPNDPDDVDEGEYSNQKVIDIMDGFNPTEIWASNGKVASAAYINDAINSGAGFVDFSGHGSPNSWATHPHNNEHIWLPAPSGYTSTHASSLSNGDKLPIIVISSCSSGDYTSSKHCLAWSFIANSEGGGIGAFSPDEISYGYIGRSVIYGLDGKMELSLFKAYKMKGAITLGEMWTRALNLYISGRMYSADYLTIEEWQPFGDPTLAIAEESNPPEKPTITGPSQGKPGEEYTFEAKTTDPDGDQIYYMFDWGDGSYSNWLGPYRSGTKIEATHTWDKKGSYEVKVKAKDDHGVVGPWSDPLPISMPITKNIPHHPTLTHIILKILNILKTMI